MNKKERREHIVQSAKALFVEKGFHNTTVTDIIREARIVRSTFYAHFTGKYDILRILIDRLTAILLDAILGINISRASARKPLPEQIRQMTEPLVEAISANRDLTSLIITAPLGHDDNFDRSVSELFAKILTAIKRLLVEGTQGGTIRSLDPEIISYIILGGIKQVLLQWLVYGDIPDIRERLEDIIAYTLFGIAKKR